MFRPGSLKDFYWQALPGHGNKGCCMMPLPTRPSACNANLGAASGTRTHLRERWHLLFCRHLHEKTWCRLKARRIARGPSSRRENATFTCNLSSCIMMFGNDGVCWLVPDWRGATGCWFGPPCAFGAAHLV